MSEQACMPLEAVETCEQAYIVYEHEDGYAYLFKRLRTDEDNILFEREVQAFMKSCPYLSKDGYGKLWFAFADKPRKCVIDLCRKKIIRYIKENMPWYFSGGYNR